MNMSPDPITAIFPVVIMNRRPRRKVVRQHSPRAAGADKIHHGVDNLPQIGSPRPAAGLGRWQERLDQVPLFICQIAWITPSVHISVIGQKVTFHTLSKKIAQKYDVLLSVRAPVGETNIADKTYCIGRGLSAISFNKCSVWYGWYLTQYFKNQLITNSQGSTFTAVNKDDISVLKVICPVNIAEQQTIASILTTCDEAIEKTDAKIEKLKRIKQGLMQDLFRYGIDEKGRMRSEKTHRFKDSPLGQIPVEWEVKTLVDVCEKIQDGTHYSPSSDDNGKFKYITSKNILFGKLDLSGITYISEADHKKIYSRCSVI